MVLILVPTVVEAALLVADAGDLQFGRPRQASITGRPIQLALCGFGLAAAGVGASYSLLNSVESIDQAILVGTAGTYDVGSAAVASAVVGRSVRCIDIGVPNAAGNRLTVEVPGLSLWPDELPLSVPETLGHLPEAMLLSVAGPAVSADHAQTRHHDFPTALAEEMEGYAVAVACKTMGVPLTIVRGISNLAGDRDKAKWRMREAMQAVKTALEIAVESMA